MPAKRYCRITFLPAGAKRKRTTWAIETTKSPDSSFRTFTACDKEGQTLRDIDAKTVQEEMIICGRGEVTVKPGYMSRKYGWLVEGTEPPDEP